MSASTPSLAALAYWECGNGFAWDDNCWSETLNGQVKGASRRPQTGDDTFLINDDLFDVSVLLQNRDLGVILNSLLIDGTAGFNMNLDQGLTAEDLFALSEIIGDIGSGAVTQTAGIHSITNNLILGNTATGVGSYSINNLSGTASLLAGDIFVGNGGTGTLLIENGAPVSSTNAYIANNIGSSGTATVDGMGSTWTNTTGLYVGGNNATAGGTGTLNVQNGGITSSATVNIWDTGTVNLDNGSLFTGSLINQGNLNVGAGGGVIDDAGAAVTGGITDRFIVGNTGTASLSVENGGTLTTTSGEIALEAGSLGTVTVDGVGSLWTDTGDLYVGGSATAAGGTGVLNIQNGGVVDVAGITKIWGPGTINLSDAALNTTTLFNEGSLLTSGISNISAVVQNEGAGIVAVTSGTTNFNNDVINNGAEFRVDAGAQAVFAGNVSGASAYTGTGTLVFNGGLISETGPSLVDVSGDMVLGASSAVTFELGGLVSGTEYDSYNVAGQLDLAGDINVVSFDLGAGFFSPVLGDTFDLFSAEILTGSLNFGTSFMLDPGLAWQMNLLTDEFGTTDVMRMSVVAVPVPPAVWLFSLGLFGLVIVAGKTKKQH